MIAGCSGILPRSGSDDARRAHGAAGQRLVVNGMRVVDVRWRRGEGRLTASIRRWLRRVAAVCAFLLLAVLAVYGWALASVQRSTTARAVVWRDADVGDQDRFPSRVIQAAQDESPLPPAPEIDLDAATGDAGGGDFDRFLRTNETLAFLVVHDDRLVFERYFLGSDRATLQTSFSVAKSILSTLIGIAIEEGHIGSVEDPVTEFVPELLERDRRFEEITLRHLLTMSSGLRYVEQENPLPWGDDITTYYGVDLRDAALEDTVIERPPGRVWLYNNYNPLLLGLVLERATGMSVSNYASTRLWEPLGAEFDASWSLDSERSGFEKLESGFNAAPVDYARFGLLFLHGGEWKGTRIVPREWVESATAGDATDPAGFYQWFWWVDDQRPDRFYALGNFGQYVYVAPDADAVIVRNGRDWGISNDAWLSTFRRIADALARR
jgi:CubicO group peptidase (beta-lactamase class C family)